MPNLCRCAPDWRLSNALRIALSLPCPVSRLHVSGCLVCVPRRRVIHAAARQSALLDEHAAECGLHDDRARLIGWEVAHTKRVLLSEREHESTRAREHGMIYLTTEWLRRIMTCNSPWPAGARGARHAIGARRHYFGVTMKRTPSLRTLLGANSTEFAPGTQPEAGNFPARDRLISGLPLGVLVNEAPEDVRLCYPN